MTMTISPNSTSVAASGFRESVAEVGEVLAWLGSALRSNSNQESVGICRATVMSRKDRKVSSSSVGGWRIRFDIENVDNVQENGKCWHHIFRNPVIATGFPILARSQKTTGLEIPLSMMAGLSQAKYLTAFDGFMFLKGFSTMLFPTQKSGNTIFWHLLYNEDRKRISYRDCRQHVHRNPGLGKIGYSDIERSRHMVGWSSAVKVYAGE